MKEVRVFLLELDATSTSEGVSELRAILQSCENPRIELHEHSINLNYPNKAKSILSDALFPFYPDVIFLASPSRSLSPVRILTEMLTGRALGARIVVVSAANKPDEMIELLKLGITDFISLPPRAVDVLPHLWQLLEKKNSEEKLLHNLKEKISLKQMIGKSPSFTTELEKIPLVARCDSSVLISGETGTGKELFARAVHYLGPRSGKPFVPVECGAIPVELLENELFGHVRGAYTSATSSHSGIIQEADGGTLLLDEVDCLPLSAQVKVLRFLQEKEFRPLGSSRSQRADVRIIAATNGNLEQAVQDGLFRRDLFYRLNVIPLTLPPLRERREDIPLLVNHFIEHYSSEFNKTAKSVAPEMMQKLLNYKWPGNVRELQHLIERAVVFAADIILPAVLKTDTETCLESFQEAKAKVVVQFEKNYIRNLLIAHHGNITQAAKIAGKNRRALWELIRKHQIDVLKFKPCSY